jgi:hypothetical protein
MDKVIFLDIDGPLIPKRQWVHSRRNTLEPRFDEFDPIAVSMVNHLIKYGPAKIVVSSAWDRGAIQAFEDNGILMELHDDTFTKKEGPYRRDEVAEWLTRHPEITHWVALDDAATPEPGGVLVSLDDGLSLANYIRAAELLEIPFADRWGVPELLDDQWLPV